MDSFIDKIFRNKTFDKAKMLEFGFKPCSSGFEYVTKILDGQFELNLFVKDLKSIETKLTDVLSNDLYTLHLIEDAAGTFVGEVRKAYEYVLNNIAFKCCNDTYFMSEQANRLSYLIKEKYDNTPEFLWEKFPGFGVFRNSKSEKWYGLISQVDFSKLDKNKKGKIEILNIKLDKDKVIEYQNFDGFYPAYHMNKKSWITVVLDSKIPDSKLMELIDESYLLSCKK